MKTEKTMLEKFAGAFLWEGRKRFYALRYPAAGYLALLLIVCVLPPAACRFLDDRATWLVALINLALSFCVIMGAVILPYSTLSYPYGTAQYRRECLSDISTSLRLLARILVNLIQSAAVIGSGYLVMHAMEKFADATHSYMQLSISGDVCAVLLVYGLFTPLIYLAVFLRMYLRYHARYYVFSWLSAVILANLILTNAKRLPRSLPDAWSECSEFLWIPLVLLLSALFFLLCCRFEKEIAGI